MAKPNTCFSALALCFGIMARLAAAQDTTCVPLLDPCSNIETELTQECCIALYSVALAMPTCLCDYLAGDTHNYTAAETAVETILNTRCRYYVDLKCVAPSPPPPSPPAPPSTSTDTCAVTISACTGNDVDNPTPPCCMAMDSMVENDLECVCNLASSRANTDLIGAGDAINYFLTKCKRAQRINCVTLSTSVASPPPSTPVQVPPPSTVLSPPPKLATPPPSLKTPPPSLVETDSSLPPPSKASAAAPPPSKASASPPPTSDDTPLTPPDAETVPPPPSTDRSSEACLSYTEQITAACPAVNGQPNLACCQTAQSVASTRPECFCKVVEAATTTPPFVACKINFNPSACTKSDGNRVNVVRTVTLLPWACAVLLLAFSHIYRLVL